MSKISNVLTMIGYLSTGRKYSISELSEKLEVTPRMIRVYKDEIEKKQRSLMIQWAAWLILWMSVSVFSVSLSLLLGLIETVPMSGGLKVTCELSNVNFYLSSLHHQYICRSNSCTEMEVPQGYVLKLPLHRSDSVVRQAGFSYLSLGSNFRRLLVGLTRMY